MSQAPRGKNDWIRNHYEKMILLAALVALLVSCILLTQRIQADKDAAKPALARIDWKGSSVAPKDTLALDGVLVAARAEATNALAVAARTTVSERRVACVKCGKPIRFEAAECPFCLAAQPAIVDIEKLDTDGDGIPDKVELSLGLDPQNPSDAAGDLDNDGFTNHEELNAKTDPKDPADFPDPIVKLRVAGIRPVPFYLRFVTTSTLGDGSIRFQLNLQTLERTYFVKPGDVVLGYKVENYNPAGPAGETITMVRQSDKRPVALVKGKPVTEQELAILFVSLIDKQRLPVQRLNDVFAYRGADYKVVDIRRDNVVIQSAKTGEKVTVPLWTPEERATMLGQPSAPAPAAGAAPQAPAAAAAASSVW